MPISSGCCSLNFFGARQSFLRTENEVWLHVLAFLVITNAFFILSESVSYLLQKKMESITSQVASVKIIRRIWERLMGFYKWFIIVEGYWDARQCNRSSSAVIRMSLRVNFGIFIKISNNAIYISQRFYLYIKKMY